MRTLNSEAFNPIWFAFAFLFVCTYLLWQGRIRELLIPKHNWFLVFGLGVCNSVSIIAFFRAIALIDPTLVSFLFRTEIVYTVLLGVGFLKETLVRQEIIGMALTLLGAGAMTYVSGQLVLEGFLLVSFSTILYSVAWLLAKRAMKGDLTPIALTAYRSGLTVVLTFLYATLLGRLAIPSLENLIVISVGSFFGPFLSLVLIYTAIPLIGISKVSILRSAQPLFVALYSLVLFGAIPKPRQLIAGALILLGVLLLTTGHKRPVSKT
jgi:drug/metabolite transporter (DMT)-like permease